MNVSASRPSMGIAMFSRTKSTASSIRSWNFPGTTVGRRNAKKNSAMKTKNVRRTRNRMKLKQKSNPKSLPLGPQHP